MRTLTTAQNAVLTARYGWCGWARVRVQDGGGTYRDLTNLFGKDFLTGVSVDDQTDMPVAQANVTVRREIDYWRLAPLITDSPLNTLTGSYDPLLKEGRTFVVETALLPDGIQPTSGDWMESFRGRIDSVDAGPDELTFTGRDMTGKLFDTFIEVERAHASQSLQNHLTKILTDNSLVSEFTLYTIGSPSTTFGAYVQKCEPVYDALQSLARQIGWEVRWKWDSGTSAYRLTLWTPNRSATSPVATFSDREYSALDTVRSTMEDIRNVVEVVYSDTADLDTTGKPKRKTYTASDATSITAYGRRWMRIAESASSNINTSTEAQKMAEAARDDLKTVNLEISATLDFRPDLELGDLVRFSGNAWHFTADQDVALVQVTHDFRGNASRTKIRAIGKPRTSTKIWLMMDTRPTVAPAPPFTGPGAPVNVAVAAIVNGIRVTWQPPTTGPSSPSAASYEVHVSTSSGFTPDSSTLKATVDGQAHEVVNLTPGVTYYAKVIPRDAKGNVGTTSSQASTTSFYVQPRLMQPLSDFYSRVLNHNYEVNSAAGSPPDTWYMAYGTWNTDVLLSSDAYSGGNAIRLLGGTSGGNPRGGLYSEYFVVRNGERYKLDVFCKGSGSAGSSFVAMEIYDSSFTYLGQAITFSTDNAVTNWTRIVKSGTVSNSSARYGRILMHGGLTSGSNVNLDSVIVDSIDAGSVYALYTRSTAQVILNATYTIVNFASAVEDAAGAVTTGANWKFTAPVAGLYMFQASVNLQSLPSGTVALVEWNQNGSSIHVGQRYVSGPATGDATLSSSIMARLFAGDYIDYRVLQNSGGSINLATGGNQNWIAITRIGP